MYLDNDSFEDFLTFDVILKSNIGTVTRKILFPIDYSEADVLRLLNQKYPELLVEEVFESDYVVHFKE